MPTKKVAKPKKVVDVVFPPEKTLEVLSSVFSPDRQCLRCGGPKHTKTVECDAMNLE